MACDWIASVKFEIEYNDNGQIIKVKVYDPNVVAVWQNNYSHDSCIQDEIDLWKRRSPDTHVYVHGQWIEDDIVFSTTEWSGFKHGTRSHTYNKQQILELLLSYNIDFSKVVMIKAIAEGSRHL
jgi:hypothetical protein